MNELNKLKPCPCCEGHATAAETEGGDYVVICDECGLTTHDDMMWGVKNYDAFKNVTSKWNTRYKDLEAEEINNKYQELIYAVARKFPDETRHETALRYINQAENNDNCPAKENQND